MFFKAEKLPETTYIMTLNEYYKNFLLNYSCCVYMLASLMIICSVMYYTSYWKQYLQLRRRRQALRRANQRLARPHRPFATFREHEVFRKVMRAVRQYQERVGERRQFPLELIQSAEILHCDAFMYMNDNRVGIEGDT